MPVFEYVGLDASGKKRVGFLDAKSEKDARRILYEKGVFLTHLSMLQRLIRSLPSNLHIALMAQQMAMFLKMGFTLNDTFEHMAQSWKKKTVQKKLYLVAYRLREGAGLEQALNDLGLFPRFFIRILSKAEKTAKLPEVLEYLGEHYERKNRIANQWIESLIYPVILLVASLIVMTIVFRWVFPPILELFREWNRPLPKLTGLILSFGNWIWLYGWFLLFIGAVLGYGAFRFYKKNSKMWVKFFFKVPVLGEILKKRNASEIAHHFALLLKGGFQIPESFSLAGEGQPFIQQELDKFKKHLEEGKPLDSSLMNPIFPTEFFKMLSVGFKSGNLIEASERVAHYYQKDLDALSNRFTALLGPLLLLGVGSFIGLIVIGVLLPIFEWSF